VGVNSASTVGLRLAVRWSTALTWTRLNSAVADEPVLRDVVVGGIPLDADEAEASRLQATPSSPAAHKRV